MATSKTLVDVGHLGLGEVLRTYRLSMPPQQREYSWTTKEVTTLLQDLAGAIRDNEEEYFLGTIVAVQKTENVREIVDGQQRMATTAILLSAIRDYLRANDPQIADNIDREFLSASSQSMRELEPKIKLSSADNQFFADMIGSKSPRSKPSKDSHLRLQSAQDECAKHVKNIVAAYDPKQHGDILVNWINFIQFKAQAVLLTISEDGNAYRMFETLNSRGLETTQADLVKAYLFGRAGPRLEEAQDKWSSIRGTLEGLDEDRVKTVTYLRHALMLRRGYFREAALHDNVQNEAKSPTQAIALLDYLETMSITYAALFNPEAEQWNGYPDSIREAIKVLSLLDIAGVRPVMLAVAVKFSKKEAVSAFRKFVSWKVRYLIAGSTLTGGYIEVPLSAVAKKVYDGDITDEKSLSKEMAGRLPTDEQFQRAFAEATVSKMALARYYLRSLERVVKETPEPGFIPNDDREVINLEHILPHKPMGNWPAFSDLEAAADVKRLGNMTLLQAKKNADLRSAGFEDKKQVFKDGPFELTLQLATLPEWNHQRVAERQQVLAGLALKAWPL